MILAVLTGWPLVGYLTGAGVVFAVLCFPADPSENLEEKRDDT